MPHHCSLTRNRDEFTQILTSVWSQKFVCWVTWEIWERPFPCATEEADAPAEEKQGQKGFMATFESCVSGKEEFLS